MDQQISQVIPNFAVRGRGVSAIGEVKYIGFVQPHSEGAIGPSELPWPKKLTHLSITHALLNPEQLIECWPDSPK